MSYPTKHLMDASAIVLFVSLSMFGLPSSAQTPDGQTPAEETVCDVLEDNLFGICNAYCEAMDCDSENHSASDKACHKKLGKWAELAGDNPIPCMAEPGISLLKTVNADVLTGEIPVGDDVIYTFEISNAGNVPIVVTDLTDPPLGNSVTGCIEALVDQTLAVNGSVSCDSEPLTAINDTVSNTAQADAVGLYGTTLSAQSTAVYVGTLDGGIPQYCTIEQHESCLDEGEEFCCPFGTSPNQFNCGPCVPCVAGPPDSPHNTCP